MGHFKAQDPGNPGKTSNLIPVQCTWLQFANYFSEGGERMQACLQGFVRDPYQTLRQQGNLDSFFQALFVCENQWIEKPVSIERTNLATCAVSNASSLCFLKCNVTMGTMSLVRLSCYQISTASVLRAVVLC